jgi:hypothetical protein
MHFSDALRFHLVTKITCTARIETELKSMFLAMSKSGAAPSMCRQCSRLRQRYASATHQREWAKADLVAATFSRDADKVTKAQLAKEAALREWEAAKAELEAHVNAHNQNETS